MRVREVDRFKYKVFLKKADEFQLEMRDALKKSRWNAAGLNGIHCMISSCDALTTYFLGKRSASTRHEDVIKLVAEIKDIDDPVRKDRTNQIISILRPKTKVEYNSVLFSEGETHILVKQVERFYSWVKSILPK